MTEYECAECDAVLTPRSEREVAVRLAVLLVPLVLAIGIIGLWGIGALGRHFGTGLLVGLAAGWVMSDPGGWLRGIASRDRVIR